MDNPINILYISYDGMTDPLGQSQVLPYLEALSKEGYNFSLISCEKPKRFEQNETRIRNICKKSNIDWYPLFYTKFPPVFSTIYDVLKIRKLTKRLYEEKKIKIIHCRSYLASLIGLEFKKKYQIKFVFDMRGFWADERVDGNLWNLDNPIYNVVYRYFKRKESEFITFSDAIVSLTSAGREEMIKSMGAAQFTSKIFIIPCCTDFDHFPLLSVEGKNKARQQLGINVDSKVITYLGSIGTWYMLPEMLDFFAVFKKSFPDALFLLITPDSPEIIYKAARRNDLKEEDFIIKFASRDEVPVLMQATDYGIFFIKPSFSKKSSSPTKLGEFQAIGLPVIANAGVGDVETILLNTKGGLIMKKFRELDYEKCIEQLKEADFSAKDIRDYAMNFCTLEVGVNQYARIYKQIID